jgi:hypothetical protein
MVTRSAVRAQGRVVDYEAAIRGHLVAGDAKAAVDEAIAAVKSELAKVRRQRPRDGMLTDSELAAQLLVFASQLHRYKPVRLGGCPPVPQPADMTRQFEAGLAQALTTGESQ